MKAYNEKVMLPSLPVIHIVRYSETIQDDVFVHPHWHDVVEILYYEQGFTRQQAGENIFITKPGDIAVIWNNQIHSTYKHGKEHCVIRVYQFAHHELWENEIINRLEFTGPINKDHPLWKTLHNILEGISSELEHKKEGFEYQIKAHIYQFFASVIKNRASLPIKTKSTKSHINTMTALFNYIDENYARPITLKSAADAVYLSTAQFMRVVKAATGMTFKSYLDLYRINQATKLLHQGYTVAQTAGSCGFQNMNTFIRVFKQIKKCTPSFYKIQ